MYAGCPWEYVQLNRIPVYDEDECLVPRFTIQSPRLDYQRLQRIGNSKTIVFSYFLCHIHGVSNKRTTLKTLNLTIKMLN